MGKQISSSIRREIRTTAKKRQRRPKKYNRATTNSMEGTTNSKKHAQKISCFTGRVQKRARQGHARRRQVVWPDMQPGQKTIPGKRRKNKIRKGIVSSQRRTLLGEVAAEEKKARRGHARKDGGPGRVCNGTRYRTRRT